VIGQQLQRHDVQDGRQRAVVLGHADHVHALAAFDVRVGIGEHVELAAAGPHFLQIALELFQQASLGATVTTGISAVDQGQRAVLEFAGRVGFGVDVADFLQLERAFQRDRVVQSTTQEQGVFLAREGFGPG
jgi:hypothetical protein